MSAYLAIDLKSFYASVECVERGLDPLTTNLIVADETRNEGTICLAVTPSLKAYGISGRPRLFEVLRTVQAINNARRLCAPAHKLCGASCDARVLAANPELALDLIIAPPHMARYLDYSGVIYAVYLQNIAPQDLFAYSVDEVFIDAAGYLATYRTTASDLARRLVKAVWQATGITATAGVGTNLYLAKVAMDILAKRARADGDGVRLAALDEPSYCRQLWQHRPLTDFWQLGPATAAKLADYGICTMGSLAQQSLSDAALLYRLFGVNAELLIDHAWGRESCTMGDIQTYCPESHSLSNGQVLPRAYCYAEAAVVVREMAEQLAFRLLAKNLVSDKLVLSVGYEGKQEQVHASKRLMAATSSVQAWVEAALAIFAQISKRTIPVRQLNISCENVHTLSGEELAPYLGELFNGQEERCCQLELEHEREKKRMQAMLTLRQKYGKNAILKGTDFLRGATTRERNGQIGGHKA